MKNRSACHFWHACQGLPTPGLDQAPWDIEGNHDEMGSWDFVSTAAIMKNLISGNLLPRVKLVISSREHRIATLPSELRPHLMVSLTGLRRDDVQKLFVAVMGDDGEREWVEICKTSPVLVRLSSVPLFLIFNAIVRKYCLEHKREPPDSMTGIMCSILEILPSSSNMMTAERITEVMQRLRPMAYQGMKEKRVTFTAEDLTRHKLQMKDVQDLIIRAPKSNMLAYRILETGCNYFFAHQTIHEMLAAEFCALTMDIPEFIRFLRDFCHEDHWSVVRKFLCGILINVQLRAYMKLELLNDSNFEKKRDLLKRSLDQRLRETTDSLQFLELFGTLYEANDAELIKSHVEKISFDGIPLTPDAMHTISSIMRRCDHLSAFLLQNCGINEEMMDILETNTKKHTMQIDILDFGEISDQTTRLFIAIAKFAARCQVKEVQMSMWSVLELGDYEFMELSECRVLGKVDVLNINVTTKETTNLFIAISKIATRCQANKVQMKQWSLLRFSRDELVELSKLTVCGKVDILDLGEVCESTFQFFVTIASVAARCQAKEVRMKPWSVLKLGEDEILELNEWTVCGKVEILDLVKIGESTSRFFITIASIAARCQAKEVRMKPWSVLKLEEDEFVELSNWTVCGKVDLLDLGAIGGRTFRFFITIARVAERCQAKEVLMESWSVLELHKDDIMELSKWTVCGKLKQLDLSWEVGLKPIVCRAVGCVVRQCGVEDLQMRFCYLTAEHIIAFQEEIGDRKFKRLDLSFNNRTLKPEGWKAIGCVVRQCDVEDLEMQGDGLTAEEITAFQKGIGDGKITRLNISGEKSSEVSNNFVDSLIGLLKHDKVKHLTANKHRFNKSQRRRLLSAVKKSNTELEFE